MSSSSAAFLRFAGLPINHSGPGDLLNRLFGYQPQIIGQHWCVALSDPALRSGPKPVLTMHPRVEFDRDRCAKAAAELAGSIDQDLEKYFDEVGQPEGPIEIASHLGDVSEISRLSVEILLCRGSDLEQVIRERLLPFCLDRLKVSYVVAVKTEGERQQSYSSLAKIATLTSELGIQAAIEAVKRRDAFLGADVRGGMELLDIVDALTRLFPIPFTLPFRRGWAAWHFYGNGFPKLFKPGYFQSFYSSFLGSIDARVSDWDRFTVDGLGPMGEANIWRLLRHVCHGVNELMSWANDHRNYAEPNGMVDLTRQLQIFAAIKFLFADLISINQSGSPYVQASFALSFIDKLANLKQLLHGGTDTQIFLELASKDQGRHVEALLLRELGRTHPELAAALCPLVGRSYARLHRHLIGEISPPTSSENAALQRLRALRNLNHGSNLSKDQFRKLYYRGKGTLPSAIVTIAFVLALALVSAPKELLGYRATILP